MVHALTRSVSTKSALKRLADSRARRMKHLSLIRQVVGRLKFPLTPPQQVSQALGNAR